MSTFRRHFPVAKAADRTYDGVVYASRLEIRRAPQLDLLMKSGHVYWWIGQPLFRLGCAKNRYRPDYLVVPFLDDALEDDVWVEDIKSVDTAASRRQVMLWREYGPCELRILRPTGNGWATTIIEGGKS